MAQIGWVEVATEDGTSGYLWYLKAESETRLRFEDYLEMSMVEAEFNQVGNQAAQNVSPGQKVYLLLYSLEEMYKQDLLLLQVLMILMQFLKT